MPPTREIFDVDGDVVFTLTVPPEEVAPDLPLKVSSVKNDPPTSPPSGSTGVTQSTLSAFGGSAQGATTSAPSPFSFGNHSSTGTNQPTSGSFGSTVQGSTQAVGGLFGSAPRPPTTPSPFGSTRATQSAQGVFGSVTQGGTQPAPSAIANTFNGYIQPILPDIVGSEIHMVVSSKHMMLASPVFKAMLNGNFKEGRALQTDGSVKVELPDDDPAAFRLLLNILHGRNRSVPRVINLKALTGIAILVDKYRMVEAIESYSYNWIASLRSSVPKSFVPDLGRWICIFWVFGLTNDFTYLTKLVIQECKGNVPSGFMDFVPLPQAVYDDINSHRRNAISELYLILSQKINEYMAPSSQCTGRSGGGLFGNNSNAKTCDALVLGTLLRSASQAGLWPVPSPPYTKASFDNVATAINGLAIESLCDSESRQAYPSSGIFRPLSNAHGMKDYFAAKTAQVSTENVNGLTTRTYKRDRL